MLHNYYRLLMFLFICLFIYFGYRDTLVNTCTQYDCKLHGFSDVISADSDRLSLCQKLPLDPSMADYVTSRRQHAFRMKTEVMVFKSIWLFSIHFWRHLLIMYINNTYFVVSYSYLFTCTVVYFFEDRKVKTRDIQWVIPVQICGSMSSGYVIVEHPRIQNTNTVCNHHFVLRL